MRSPSLSPSQPLTVSRCCIRSPFSLIVLTLTKNKALPFSESKVATELLCPFHCSKSHFKIFSRDKLARDRDRNESHITFNDGAVDKVCMSISYNINTLSMEIPFHFILFKLKRAMEMLIQRSLPNPLNADLSLVPDLVNQQNILCDLSNCGYARQSPPNRNIKFLKKSTCLKKGENKLHSMENMDISKFNSDIFLSKNACTEPASRWKGVTYKRKKPHKGNTLACNNFSSKWGGIIYKKKRLPSSNLVKKSSSQDVSARPSSDINPTRDFCISILKMNGLLVGKNSTRVCESSEAKSVSYANRPQFCKICETMGNPLEMLICDVCEGAFHPSCYHPKIKKKPIDYWFCHPCYRKRSKALLRKSSENLADIMNENRNYRGKGGPIMCMLRGDQPFMFGVRIGNAYQAEVPEWSGPLSEDFSNEPESLDLSKCADLNVLDAEETSATSFIGNWIQCRDIIRKNSKYKGTICGKWRRAPLFVVQTDKWDCSCCLLWDPVHADCAVPQELETDVILEHLKYLEMLRTRLNI